jgi:hypothetical protein
MALVNILPTWVVLVGRQLILTLGGGTTNEVEEEETTGAAVTSDHR